MMQRRNILLIGIGFYDYERIIVEELQKRYAKVYYINAVYQSAVKKVLAYFSTTLVKKLESKYLQKELLKLPNDINDILIIKGDKFEEDHIRILKNRYNKANICLYLWDSLNRIDNAALLLREFDNILTFDRKDSIKYNLKFRPLFYREVRENNMDNQYDVSFIGWMHSNRYKILHELKMNFEKHNLNYRFILYSGKISYLINRYIKKIICKEDSSFFIFKPIPYNEYISISSNSKVILDLSHPLQSGLTMRTIEAIGLKKKILTTNVDIKNYPMLNKKNYQILFQPNLFIDYSFFSDSYVDDSNSYFSLKSFIEEILDTFVK